MIDYMYCCLLPLPSAASLLIKTSCQSKDNKTYEVYMLSLTIGMKCYQWRLKNQSLMSKGSFLVLLRHDLWLSEALSILCWRTDHCFVIQSDWCLVWWWLVACFIAFEPLRLRWRRILLILSWVLYAKSHLKLIVHSYRVPSLSSTNLKKMDSSTFVASLHDLRVHDQLIHLWSNHNLSTTFLCSSVLSHLKTLFDVLWKESWSKSVNHLKTSEL